MTTEIASLETSPETDKLDAALAKAQGTFTTASKDKENTHFHSKYADLASFVEACRESLAVNSISVTQWPLHSTDGRQHMITRLAHAGQWMRAHSSMPVGKQDAHGYMSALTYLRRGALCAALNIVADADDDGNQAVQRQSEPQRRQPPPPQRRAPSVERGTPLRDAREEITNGTASTVPQDARATTAFDPKMWAQTTAATDFMRLAKADLPLISTKEELSAWQLANKVEVDAVTEHAHNRRTKSGVAWPDSLKELIDDAQDRCRAQTTDYRV